MNIMDGRSICLPDRLDLTWDTHGVDDKKAGRRCPGLGGLYRSMEALAYPGTIIGAVQALARPLKGTALILDPWETLFDEIAGPNDLRAVPVPQQNSDC